MTLTFEDLKNNAQQSWDNYVEHDFIKNLAKGTLSKGNFNYYQCQEHYFIIEYAKAWGLGIYLSTTQQQMELCGKNASALLNGEIDEHFAGCEQWGLSKETILNTPIHKKAVGYTSYVMECGNKYGFVDLITALSVCVIGYAESGKMVGAWNETLKVNNPYQDWIDMYSNPEYHAQNDEYINFINELYSSADEKTQNRQYEIFKTATELETAFRDMSLENEI